jgi:glycosyltransferase involved in cell wall biosynthesis
MSSPKISIVIPSYNKVKYIEKTLQSIVTQKNASFEVIIQDGGSTDGTLDVIKKYAKKYPSFISFESKKDGGQLDAINKGIKKAKGEIVTFINADDEYTKGTFESVVGHYIESPDALWFAGKGIVIDENNNEIAKIATLYKSFLLNQNSHFYLLVTNYLMQPSVFLTKKTIKKYGLFTGTDFSIMEYEMWLKIGKDEMPICINKVLTKFRLEKDTKTSINANKLLSEDEKIIRKYTRNNLIIFLHILHNYFRVIMSKLI